MNISLNQTTLIKAHFCRSALQLVITLAMVTVLTNSATADQSDEVVHEGTVFRTFAFPDFLDPSFTNSTTRAWNLGGEATSPTAASDQTLNGILLDGPDDDGFDELAVFQEPFEFSSSVLNYGADTVSLVRNNLAGSGLMIANLHPTGQWSVNIAATPGRTYVVELLGAAAVTGANGSRNLDVTVDGVLFADNFFVPATSPFSAVYRFNVTADSDGIDLLFTRGTNTTWPAEFSTRPLINAIAVTGNLLTITSPASADVPENTTLVHALTADDSNATFSIAGSPSGTDILGPGQSLGIDETIVSADGTRTLLMQSDGNLVVYGPGGSVDWASGTNGLLADSVTMGLDSNLTLLAGNNVVWESASSTTEFEGAYLKLENNGQMVIYRVDGERLSESTFGDPNGGGTNFSPAPLDPIFVFAADNDLFEVVNGELHFKSAPDFENPIDMGGTAGDNIYEVSVLADDGNGRLTVQQISVMVTDEIEVLLGDVNLDGVVNLLDVSPFIALISSGTYQAEADLNGDGVVNLLDVSPFIALLSN